MSVPRKLMLALAAFFVAALFVQLLPYGHDHINPPVTAPVAFDSQQTAALARRACMDCHSHETKWPWYSKIAPISWRIQNHVAEGREKFNLSAFDPANEKMTEAAGEAGETIQKGEMPPRDYLLAHPEARLSATEKQALIAGFDAMFAKYGEKGGEKEVGEAGEATPGGGKAAAPGTAPAKDRDGDRD
jgi:hypothetical protein